MKSSIESATTTVPPEEVARRIAEYRRMGFEHQAMPHVVYEGLWVACPWPGCGYAISAMDFKLETGNPDQYSAYLAAWWQGRGLVGRCPGCGQFVLFTYHDKQCIANPELTDLCVLPDDWHQRAYIVH